MILFNTLSSKLSNRNTSAKIGYREAQVLELLIQHSPNVVKKCDIIQHAWGNQYVGETSLAKSISSLRHALLKLGANESPIVTVPKVGYRLINDCIACDTQKTVQREAIQKAFVDISAPRSKVTVDDQPNSIFHHYRFSICYLSAFILLFSASLLAFSKSYGWHWENVNSKHSLIIRKIDMIDVIRTPDTHLNPELLALISKHQCRCVVYFEQNDQYAELSIMDRNRRRSINIFYTHGQPHIVSNQILSFLEESQL
ncbi:winged helix-turn-helix domain-containing protein [Vibrio aquimaris]|uniref:DNA-binding transcriptional activator CadC n=1 Tax=Vibrio aquimaris TaxID=2587862 RepID=A0A5P9CNM2_9VIBR|nr:winged helix-turn-helix domain-containing protein [Vibrio aquimaris]QFT27573.1 DNA-binding transcriptional activator CadC [Vibrio aquimaris]